MPAHDNLEEILARLFRKLLNAHIIDNQQIRFQITVHYFGAIAEVFRLQKFVDGIEDRAVQHGKANLCRLMSDCLNQMRLAHTSRKKITKSSFNERSYEWYNFQPPFLSGYWYNFQPPFTVKLLRNIGGMRCDSPAFINLPARKPYGIKFSAQNQHSSRNLLRDMGKWRLKSYPLQFLSPAQAIIAQRILLIINKIYSFFIGLSYMLKSTLFGTI